LEEQLLLSQKMEALGRLAGGVAHDFNNLLTIILGYAQLVEDRLGQENPLRSSVEEIKKAGERAASLTRQLLAFGRRQVLMPQVLDLNAVVSNIDKMLRRLIGEDIELVTVPAEDLGRVKADPGHIDQIIMNLAVNARDAMPRGGKLTIETRNVEFDASYAQNHAGTTLGPYIMLAVSDTGVGMDSETQARIFEPFFTTKEKGKGTGLGLATVYGIVKQSGGYIWVYSEPGRGTTFKIYFPRIADEVHKAVPPAQTRIARSAAVETILVVEDEDGVRSMVQKVLESCGYRVLVARSGEDALGVLKHQPGRVDLLVTDMVMPGMDGKTLADHLSVFYRSLKVLFMSGYTENTAILHEGLDSSAAFLQKPFSPEVLAAKVRAVLDSPSAQDEAA
jgi:CheY-like chemotaxis protein